MALESTGLIVLCGAVGVIVGVIAAAGNVGAAIVLGFPLVLGAIAALVYLYTAWSFAPALIVLERLPVISALTRSFALVRNSFWRVFGIRVLTWLVVTLISGAVAVPFEFLGTLLGGGGPVLLGPDGGGRRIGDRPDHYSPFQCGRALSCSTPTAGFAARHSIWCCRPVPPGVPRR